MLVLLVCLMWTIALVGFLVKSAIGSEIIKNLRKRSVISKICALVSFIGFIAWGGVKPNMDMQSSATSQTQDFNSSFSSIPSSAIISQAQTTQSNNSSSFTEEELETRIVFLGSCTNSSSFVAAPTNAIINEKWVMTGAAEDYFFISPTNWVFYINDNTYSNLYVSTTGNISFEKPITRVSAFTNQFDVISPFRSVQGVLPCHLWNELGTNIASRFWYAQTEYNSLLLTWENFLYLRNADFPISYQAELFKNGEFEFRYNLDSLPSTSTNAFIGYQVDDLANKYASIIPQTKTIKAKRLDSSIENNKDSDGDGISDADEIFIYGTEPILADSDFDGMNDNQEILTGSNPLNPDEDGDGNRDYLTPEISNPNGLVVASPWQASAVFVFNTNLSAGEFATLVIDFTTVIPLSNQSQVYLNLEQGRLYNYKIYSSRNIVAEYSFRNLSEVSRSNARTNRISLNRNSNIWDIINETASSENSKIVFLEQNHISNSAPLFWQGYVGDVILAFVHLSDFSDYPLSNTCLHGKESISFELKAFPSELLNLGTISDVTNLERRDNNIYTMYVDGTVENPNIGSISFKYKERDNSINYIPLSVSAHQCEGGAICNGCGVHHSTSDGCEAHQENCNLLLSKTEECSCEYTFAEICFDDCNNNGIEDRFEYCGKGLFSLYVLDPVDDCCCTNWNTNAVKEFSTFEIVTIPDNITFTTNTASSVLFIPKEPSGELGYTPITYDVYGRDGKKTTTVTKKVVVGGAEFLFDYNDDGQVNNADKVLQKQYTNTNYYIYASPKKRPARVRVEMPPNVSSTLQSSDEFSFYTSSNGSLISQPMSLSNGTNMVYLQTAITNSLANINLECGSHLSKDNQFSIVKTALSDIETKFAKEITLPYYGSGIENQVDIYNYRTGALVDSFISDGKWVVYLAEGEYRLVVHYNDIYKNGIKGFFEECKLSVIGSNSIAGDYGLKCGTNNFLRIDLLNIDNLPFDITWKISPTRLDGAKLSVSEDVDDAAHQIISNASSIYIYAGTATNNYTISGWMGNTEVVSSTNISVHVFPYEIDAPDQIVRSHSVKSAPISVETLSAYANHSWKLTKTYDLENDTSLNSKISIDKNSYANNVYGNKIYYKSNKAGEKYKLTATHELYTNVTDTVELRTCDIFFNPISCEVTNSTYIVNPRGFVYGDENYYKLELYPKTFLNNESNITWEGKYRILFQPYDDYNLSVKLVPPQKYDYSYTNTISIIIPDYYEEPPKFDVLIYPEYKTIKIQPIIIKRSQNEYINYEEDSIDPMNYNWSSKDAFRINYTNQLSKGLSYSQKIFRQAGIRFEVDSTTELISPANVFYDLIGNNTITNYNSSIYNGIKLYLVDSFENSYKGENAITIHTGGYPRICFGIIITKHTQTEAFPNEIGHMLGLDDIYGLNNPNLADAIYEQNEITNDTTGVNNYYSKTRNQIIFSCVMYGCLYPGPQVNYAKILPLGSVFGSVNNDNHSPTASINVGLRGINTNVVSYGEIIQ
ncbi:MAG: hypothetical protein IJ444_09310 [Kiritimatiellae bacterium]|nr:hypothetical protein [Kiritimatiellia bacterium]